MFTSEMLTDGQTDGQTDRQTDRRTRQSNSRVGYTQPAQQHSINIKNYTAHPHDLVHVPAKFRENASMRFRVTVRKLNVTDGQTDGQTDGRTDRRTDRQRQTDGGRCNISRPGPSAPREIIIEEVQPLSFLS